MTVVELCSFLGSSSSVLVSEQQNSLVGVQTFLVVRFPLHICYNYAYSTGIRSLVVDSEACSWLLQAYILVDTHDCACVVSGHWPSQCCHLAYST